MLATGLISGASVVIALYISDEIQTERIAAQTKRIDDNAQSVKDLGKIAAELPLLRQSLDSNNNLINIVIEGLQKDQARTDNRLGLYIEGNGERQRALEARIRTVEQRQSTP